MSKGEEFTARIPSMRPVCVVSTFEVMKNSSFRIVPLATEVAEAARAEIRRGAPDHRIVIADSPTGFPCRHCLRWAKSGERLILFPFAAIPSGRPYSEIGPIFVHADECKRYNSNHKYPADLREGRVIRAYDAEQSIVEAEVVHGSEPEAIIEKFLEKPETAFVHVRSASSGCYTMRIERI
jgi:hypothetical protein